MVIDVIKRLFKREENGTPTKKVTVRKQPIKREIKPPKEEEEWVSYYIS